jgi:hypothetical protein
MRDNFRRWLSIISVAFLCLSLLLIFLLGWLNPPLDEIRLLMFAFLYCCTWIPLLFFSAVWLISENRDYLFNTFVWLGFQVIFVLTMFGSQVSIPSISVLSASAFFIFFPLLGIVNFIYAIKRSFSLRLIGIGSIGFVWSILLAWRIHGNLLEKWTISLISNSNDLLWLNVLMALTGWMVFSGIVCFFVETFQSLMHEYSS